MTEVTIGEKDPIPFPSIMYLLQTELLVKHGDNVIITDLEIATNPGTLRKITKTDIKEEHLKERLFPGDTEERSMSDVIRITESIVNDKKSTSAEKTAATTLLHTLFEERANHNELIITKIRKFASTGDKIKLHAMLWDDEGHTSVVLYCDPKYYFLDSCGCRQFGRHPMTPTEDDHLLVSRTQFDGYNCRTMSYIIVENTLNTFEANKKEEFNTYFTSPNYFGAYVGKESYKMRMANGTDLCIMCERDPKNITDRELGDPISIPHEICVIAQRSAVFKAYIDVFVDRKKILEQNVQELTKTIKKIERTAEQAAQLKQALKDVFKNKIIESKKFEGREGEIEGEVTRLFNVLEGAGKFNQEYTLKDTSSGIVFTKEMYDTRNKLISAAKLARRVGELKDMVPQLKNEQAEVLKLEEKLAKIEQAKTETILTTSAAAPTQSKTTEDSKAVVAKRTANLGSLSRITTVVTDALQPPKPVFTGKPLQKTMDLGGK